MKRMLLLPAFLVGVGVAVRARSDRRQRADELAAARAELAALSRAANSPHTKWISKSLSEMQTIKPGMTRAQLAEVFTTEGGWSTRTERCYVYRECPYIKVDVTFKPVGESSADFYEESSSDVITKISKPFLEWMIID